MTSGETAREHSAALTAPIVDRLRMAMMNRNLAAGLPASFLVANVDPAAGMMLAYLRNAWPDRVVARSSVRAVFTYQPDRPVDALLDALTDLGVLEAPGAELVRLTELGQRLLADLHLGASAVADALWSDAEDAVATAAPLVSAVLDAARGTGGETFALMAPDHLPAGMSTAGVLAEQLTGLRFHRFDAHVRAWRAAGYSVEELESLSDEQRLAIENATNVRAGEPYAQLGSAERRSLVDALSLLPS